MARIAILNLGVHKVSYGARGSRGAMGTARLARILEGRYGVMRAFYENNKPMIAGLVTRSLKGSLINVALGQPGPIVISNMATSSIDNAFKQSITTYKYDHWIGRGPPFPVPTIASLLGISHRTASPKAARGKKNRKTGKRERVKRPSFRDTGLYQAQFVSWISKN
jgi:hypothetical protein